MAAEQSLWRRAAMVALVSMSTSAWPATGIQVGPTGKTYASSAIQCAMNPVAGMAPMVQAGLYNPHRSSQAAVSLNGVAVATANFLSPDVTVWLANQVNTVAVSFNRGLGDQYTFDASLPGASQPNICIPDTSANVVSGDLETAASGKSSAGVSPGCALNPASGRAQPYVTVFDNATYLLNVSINYTPLTQLNGITRRSIAVFLSAGQNVISAANGAISTDYFVRDGKDGSCALQ